MHDTCAREVLWETISPWVWTWWWDVQWGEMGRKHFRLWPSSPDTTCCGAPVQGEVRSRGSPGTTVFVLVDDRGHWSYRYRHIILETPPHPPLPWRTSGRPLLWLREDSHVFFTTYGFVVPRRKNFFWHTLGLEMTIWEGYFLCP